MGQKISTKLKLLMITRRVDKNDSQAGFTYGWVKKFAQNIDVLKVICLEKGNTEGLPNNVEIFSLGKEKGKNRIKEFINFQIGALKFIRKIDGVFCHMNPEYTILIAPYAKIFRKKIITWYSHKAINWKARLINTLADKIVTPTKEGFGIKSKKKNVVGHGIDTELFKPAIEKKKSNIFRIISVGRISPIKDYKVLMNAYIELIGLIVTEIGLKSLNILPEVIIVGDVGLSFQKSYYDSLKKKLKSIFFGEMRLDKDIADGIDLEEKHKFIGLIPNQELPKYYQESDLSINLCPTGSPDKAVLESMACGLPVLVANKTFRNDFGYYANKLIFKHGNAGDLAEKIIDLAGNDQLKEIGLYLREQVVKNHNLDNLVKRILILYKI